MPQRKSATAGEASVEMIASPPIDSQSELLFWESIKDSPRAGDYMAYLDQYPDGIFVPLARARLEDTSVRGAEPSAHDEEVEILFRESVRNSDNPSSLRAYLEKYPEGDFKTLAEIRLLEIEK